GAAGEQVSIARLVDQRGARRTLDHALLDLHVAWARERLAHGGVERGCGGFAKLGDVAANGGRGAPEARVVDVAVVAELPGVDRPEYRVAQTRLLVRERERRLRAFGMVDTD